jgi:hypothetical protein
MNYFELWFLASVPLSIVIFLVAGVSAFRGRRQRAIRIVKCWGLYLAVYMAVALAVDFIQPRHTMRVGDPWCFDHWCLAVEKVDVVPAQSETAYNIKLRIFNSSHRVVQWTSNAWIYLIDDKGHLYPPVDDPSAVRLDIKLQPEQSVMTSHVFHVPAKVQDLGLITGHGGSYCNGMGLFIIGGASCLFNKPPMVRIVPAGGL